VAVLPANGNTAEAMPTYEYRCPDGHRFELIQKMSEEPRASCPTCGKEAQRLLSAGAGLLFKGSGFYITDYRSDSYRSAARNEEGGASKPSTPEGGSSADGKAAAPDGGGGSKESAKDAPKEPARGSGKASGSGGESSSGGESGSGD
jgi:putative FmdB family regulatory protein